MKKTTFSSMGHSTLISEKASSSSSSRSFIPFFLYAMDGWMDGWKEWINWMWTKHISCVVYIFECIQRFSIPPHTYIQNFTIEQQTGKQHSHPEHSTRRNMISYKETFVLIHDSLCTACFLGERMKKREIYLPYVTLLSSLSLQLSLLHKLYSC